EVASAAASSGKCLKQQALALVGCEARNVCDKHRVAVDAEAPSDGSSVALRSSQLHAVAQHKHRRSWHSHLARKVPRCLLAVRAIGYAGEAQGMELKYAAGSRQAAQRVAVPLGNDQPRPSEAGGEALLDKREIRHGVENL